MASIASYRRHNSKRCVVSWRWLVYHFGSSYCVVPPSSPASFLPDPTPHSCYLPLSRCCFFALLLTVAMHTALVIRRQPRLSRRAFRPLAPRPGTVVRCRLAITCVFAVCPSPVNECCHIWHPHATALQPLSKSRCGSA